MRALKWRSRKQPGQKPLSSRRMLLVYFDSWRDAAADVEAAWGRWRAASPAQRAQAALAFFAALDREEKAASAYRVAWEG